MNEPMKKMQLLELSRKLLRILGIGSGTLLATCCAIWVGFDSYGMDRVRVGVGVGDYSFLWEGWSLTPPWFALIVLYSATFPLTSTLSPQPKRDMPPVWISAWMLFLTVSLGGVSANLRFMFNDPEDCIYADCWPFGWQQVISSLPLVTTLIVWVTLSLLASRVKLVVRLTVPPLLFITLSTALAAAWRPYVAPILLGPPPF